MMICLKYLYAANGVGKLVAKRKCNRPIAKMHLPEAEIKLS